MHDNDAVDNRFEKCEDIFTEDKWVRCVEADAERCIGKCV